MNRRQFLVSTVAATAVASFPSLVTAQSRPATTQASLPDDLVWHDVRDWGVEGRAFYDTENFFDRLPKRAKGVVRPEVWGLSRHTAGMSVRFRAASPSLYVRYEVTSASLAMPHMPATGVSGLDLYTPLDGKWHWMTTFFPKSQSMAAPLVAKMPSEKRTFQINLPLYNGVKSLEIGVPKGANFEPIAPRKEKPILFYGTSVTQGGCASRPGMVFTHILGRRLDRPMLNLGFSGNGRMEVEVAKFLAELDPAIFVLDCLANMSSGAVTDRTEAVTKLLREARPETPILILSERPYGDVDFNPQRMEEHHKRTTELKTAYDNLIAAGVKNLHYRTGEDVVGADGEGTVDGSHPTDLGMMRYADALEPTLRELLKAATS